MEVHLRTIRDKNGFMVAICDAKLLGQTFRQGKLKLDVSQKFYGGRLCTVDEAMMALADADIGNLVGKTTIEAAIEKGLVDSEAVIYFGKVPHVQMVRL